jgi:hypothetical protein
LFNACVKSVLLYGCETWFVTNNTTQKLQAFVNKCLRNILVNWWPQIISNEELWERTEQPKIDVHSNLVIIHKSGPIFENNIQGGL